MAVKKRILSVLWCLPVAAGAADLSVYPGGAAADLDAGGRRIQVVNVWASWCAPCRREMPVLSAWYQRERGKRRVLPLQMVGVAVDTPANIGRFLAAQPVSYPVWRYGGSDAAAWMKGLGNAPGALPYTVVRVSGCTHRKHFFGEVGADKLTAAVAEVARLCA